MSGLDYLIPPFFKYKLDRGLLIVYIFLDLISIFFFLDAFATSLKQSKGKPKYSFYDGPPFATGLPHYGHILAGTIKVQVFLINMHWNTPMNVKE